MRKSSARTEIIASGSQNMRGHSPRRKFFYLLTCEYCLSHYVAAVFLGLTGFKLLYSDWRGYLVAFFSLIWVANQYMSIYNHLRLDIKHEQVQIKVKEKEGAAQERKAA